MSNTQKTVSNNRSKTADGHTMSKIDVMNELAVQERELLNSHKGLESSCGKCGESFRMSNIDNTLREAIVLDIHLANGGCPSCNNWKTADWHSKRNDLLEMTFELNGVEIKTLRIPAGFKTRKIIQVDDKGRALLKF